MIPTKDQQMAIDYNGNMVVIAKPGSGKTFIITSKIKKILPTLKPHQGVIAISYTNKASNELKRRITQNGTQTKGSFISTIDKFCFNEIIAPFCKHIISNVHKDLQICSINQIPKQYGFLILNRPNINNYVTYGTLVDNFTFFEKCLQNGLLFVECLGALALYTLRKSFSCQRYLKAKYTHFFVDEYQDAGQDQHELLLFIKELGITCIAVGDADQSIFEFCGKSSKYILELPNLGFQNFVITYNQRSHISIVNYANKFLSTNSQIVENNDLRVIELNTYGNNSSIAKWIDSNVEIIKEHFSIQSNSSIAILTPKNKTAQEFNGLLKSPHYLCYNHPIEDRQSISSRLLSDMLHYRYSHTYTAEEIIERYAPNCQSNMLRKHRLIIKQIRTVNYDQLLAKMQEVIHVLLPSVDASDDINLLCSNTEDEMSLFFSEPKQNEIQIMTIHKSKGLEFDVIFHLDLLDWVFPAKRPQNGIPEYIYPNLDQDTHLHYVAITRAKKLCYLCYPSIRRNSQGIFTKSYPSCFLRSDISCYRKLIKISPPAMPLNSLFNTTTL